MRKVFEIGQKNNIATKNKKTTMYWWKCARIIAKIIYKKQQTKKGCTNTSKTVFSV